MRIAIWNENTTQAGQLVGDRELEQAEADNEGCNCDPWESGDWTVFEGEPRELAEIAKLREQNARTGGGGSFDRRVAASIRSALSPHSLDCACELCRAEHAPWA